MSSPSEDVARALAAVEAASSAARASVESVEARSVGSDLVATSDASAVKAAAAARYAVSVRAREDLAAARAAANEAIERQRRDLEAQVRAMAELLEPLERQIQQAQEVIHTVNLYLGRDEEVVTITTGRPAPADSPLVLRQGVLAMDEETGARAADGGIDLHSVSDFDEWVASDPANLDRLVPEPRGVVAITIRREPRNYGDPWTNATKNEVNLASWFLVRNGENSYRVLTDFRVGRRLVPRADEFTALFVDSHTGRPLEPGSEAWVRAERVAGARERHYMKVALILQGLVDRTEVLRPLPEGGLSLLSNEAYDSGRVVLLADEELAITSGRTPFRRWLRERNGELAVGARVMIVTRHADFERREGGAYGTHARVTPPRAELPVSGEAYVLTRRGRHSGSFVFTYERTVEEYFRDAYGRGEYRVPRTRASFVVERDDEFVLPVDRVTVAELEDYLGARTERHEYAAMFPTLRAALALKRREAAEEEPFRALLASEIARVEGTDPASARAAADTEVTRWRLGNAHYRPLTGEPEVEARAAREILAERARRVAATGDADVDTRVVAALRSAHPDAVLVARRKSGRYVVLAPQPRRWALPSGKGTPNPYGDQVGALDVFLVRTEYTARDALAGTPRSVEEWTTLRSASLSRLVVLHEGPRLASTRRDPNPREHLTDPEIEAGVAAIVAAGPRGEGELLAVLAYEDSDLSYDRRRFHAYYQPRELDPGSDEALLTGARRSVSTSVLEVPWSRGSDGRVSYRLGGDAHASSVSSWSSDRLRSPSADGERVVRVRAPYEGDRRENHVVLVDDAVYERGAAATRAAHALSERAEALRAESRRLVEGVEEAWLARADAEARARFVEDYGDGSLYVRREDAHAPFARRWNAEKGFEGTAEALARLTDRLVETGRAPWGLTVGEALTTLDEPLVEVRRPWGDRPVTIASAVLDLRYPPAPAAAP